MAGIGNRDRGGAGEPLGEGLRGLRRRHAVGGPQHQERAALEGARRVERALVVGASREIGRQHARRRALQQPDAAAHRP